MPRYERDRLCFSEIVHKKSERLSFPRKKVLFKWYAISLASMREASANRYQGCSWNGRRTQQLLCHQHQHQRWSSCIRELVGPGEFHLHTARCDMERHRIFFPAPGLRLWFAAPQTFTRHNLTAATGFEGIINGTMAIMLNDLDLYVTPFNVSMAIPHM
jgi:hypothetical protein